jgi:hypothetical protein
LEKSDFKVHAGLSEVVLYQEETAKECHKNLFALDDSCYFSAGSQIIASVISICQKSLRKLHIAAGWEAILRVALWTENPTVHDVFFLIKKCGVPDEEMGLFRRSEIHDIFPWLYYGRRVDVLRKICNAAKAKAESKIDMKNLRVYCHLVSGETKKIVASSL